MSKNGLGPESRGDSWTEFEIALSHLASTVWGQVRDANSTGFRSLTVNCRGNHDWLAMARRYDEHKGTWVIAFGNGQSFSGSIQSLHKSISGEKWYEDRYPPKEVKP